MGSKEQILEILLNEREEKITLVNRCMRYFKNEYVISNNSEEIQEWSDFLHKSAIEKELIDSLIDKIKSLK